VAHVLLKLRDVRFEDVKQKLKADASGHNAQGMYLEHVWRNAEDPVEVLFLFRVDDLEHVMQMMKSVHAAALEEDPNAKLPQATFLDGA
jgi:hypothetical protein